MFCPEVVVRVVVVVLRQSLNRCSHCQFCSIFSLVLTPCTITSVLFCKAVLTWFSFGALFIAEIAGTARILCHY